MSTQYDFNPGLDLTSLSSATLAQVVQAISQIAPLSNIGGIICSATTPDVANNPRFSRYIWIDITSPTVPVIKTYNGTSWAAAGVAADSITTAMIHAIASRTVDDALGGVDIPRLKVNAAGTAVAGDIGKVPKVESGGRYFELALPDDLFGIGALSLNKLSVTGANNYDLLNIVGGTPVFDPFDPTLHIGSGKEIPATKLKGSSSTDAHKIYKVDATGLLGELAYPTIIQRTLVEDDTAATVNSVIDSAVALGPSSNYGSEYAALKVNPFTLRGVTATSRLKISGMIYGRASNTLDFFVVIFDGTTYRIAGIRGNMTTSSTQSVPFAITITPPASSTVIQVFLGVSAASFYLNSTNGTTKLFGGSGFKSFIEVLEVI